MYFYYIFIVTESHGPFNSFCTREKGRLKGFFLFYLLATQCFFFLFLAYKSPCAVATIMFAFGQTIVKIFKRTF